MPLAHLDSPAAFDELLGSSGVPVLIDFWATWCGPCVAMAPVLDQAAASYGDRLAIAKVDVDAVGALAQRFSIMSIPTLVLFRDGAPVLSLVGGRGLGDLTRELDAFVSPAAD